MGKPRNTRKYPTYPEIPENKRDTRKYPIVYFDTPTRPEPDPLPGILFNTRPYLILKNSTRWALFRTIRSEKSRMLTRYEEEIKSDLGWQDGEYSSRWLCPEGGGAIWVWGQYEQTWPANLPSSNKAKCFRSASPWGRNCAFSCWEILGIILLLPFKLTPFCFSG